VKLQISPEHSQAMKDDAAARYPVEACGLVAGVQGESRAVFPLANVLSSPHRYLADPTEMARALWEIDRRGWEVAAVYHSHPFGGFAPSEEDAALARFPVPLLIWTLHEGEWMVSAYLLLPEKRLLLPRTRASGTISITIQPIQ